MKKYLLLTSLICHVLHSWEPHRIYIGPDFLYRSYSEDLPPPAKSDEDGFLAGFQIGYDYLKKNMPYFGAHIRGVYGDTNYDGSICFLGTGVITPYKGETGNGLGNIEIRAGYNFSPLPQALITPFFGWGGFAWNRDICKNSPYGYSECYTWGYLAYGVRWEYQVNTRFRWGTYFTLQQMVDGKIEIYNSIDLDLGNRLQYKIELPLRGFFPVKKGAIDVSIVPYYWQQNIGASDKKIIKFPGCDPLLIGEPASCSFSVGARIELGYNF